MKMAKSAQRQPRKQHALFSKRLAFALEVIGVPLSATALQREYNSRSKQPPITSHAARKWLMGEAIPNQDRIQILAAWLNVSASWLRFGEEIEDEKMSDLTPQEWRLIRGFRCLNSKQRVSILSLTLAIPAGQSRGK
jgi:hypothetical protein